MLPFVPAGPDSDDGPAVADVVDGDDLFGEHRGMAVGVAVNQHADLDPAGFERQRRQQGRCLEARAVRVRVEGHEMIEEQDGVEPELLGHLPLRNNSWPGQLMLPGHHAERQWMPELGHVLVDPRCGWDGTQTGMAPVVSVRF